MHKTITSWMSTAQLLAVIVHNIGPGKVFSIKDAMDCWCVSPSTAKKSMKRLREDGLIFERGRRASRSGTGQGPAVYAATEKGLGEINKILPGGANENGMGPAVYAIMVDGPDAISFHSTGGTDD